MMQTMNVNIPVRDESQAELFNKLTKDGVPIDGVSTGLSICNWIVTRSGGELTVNDSGQKAMTVAVSMNMKVI